MRRTGSYAIGQVAVATINAVCSWIMMMIVGIPYAAVLAVAVGFLGLIPMVGATIGAAVVCLVAVFDEPKKAVIALVYYVIYQQLENYVVAPRIMQRTVSVPGAVTVVAALAGGTLLGVLGALLAIPVAAGLLLLYEEVLLPASAATDRDGPRPTGLCDVGRATCRRQRQRRSARQRVAPRVRRRSRASQHGVCQCRRSSSPPMPSAGQATTCGVPTGMSCWQPGHGRPGSPPLPVTRRTNHSPPAYDSRRAVPPTARSRFSGASSRRAGWRGAWRPILAEARSGRPHGAPRPTADVRRRCGSPRPVLRPR